jgi:hypothetical protein
MALGLIYQKTKDQVRIMNIYINLLENAGVFDRIDKIPSEQLKRDNNTRQLYGPRADFARFRRPSHLRRTEKCPIYQPGHN